jgi:hypothetical protein
VKGSTLRLRDDAYTPGALIEAGVPAALVRTLIADGPRAVPERARESVTGRRRSEPTTHYVWGPDARRLLSEVKANHVLQSAGLRLASQAEIDSESSREESAQSGGPR